MLPLPINYSFVKINFLNFLIIIQYLQILLILS